MTIVTIEAVWEHGRFCPITPVHSLSEGQKVRLVVEPIESPDYILALTAQVYEGLSNDQIDSIEVHTRRREGFFHNETSA